MAHNAHSLQKAFRYLFTEEVDELQRLAMLLPPNPTVVNIGAGSGTSGLAFLECRDDLTLTTIDIQQNDSPFGCLVAEKKVVWDAGYQDRLTQIHGDSKIVGANWLDEHEKVDMVFVDGGHSYDECKGDIEAWLKNITSGGTIAIHDYNKTNVFLSVNTEYAPHPVAWAGVDKAVNGFIKQGNEPLSIVKTLISFKVE